MPDEQHDLETNFLSCCYLDGSVIDRGVAAGVTAHTFRNPHHHEQWAFLCSLRLAGKPTEFEGVYTEAQLAGILPRLGDITTLLGVSGKQTAPTFSGQYMRGLLDADAKRKTLLCLSGAVAAIDSGTATVDSLRDTAEKIAGICSGQQSVHRALSDVADEAITDAEEARSGATPTRTLIYTGLPMFDKYATPMETHEYVVVGARTSHGKSTFMTQVAGHNLSLGRRVAILTLETSDKAVLKQIVAQRAKVNLRRYRDELPAKQQEYIDKLKFVKTTKNLMIFDRDIQLDTIEARCRLLAASFKPELVIVDYLGLIQVPGSSQYERVTAVSKAMIPLRKILGCTLMLGCQLGRGPEKDEREPQRTDFRDSGSIEEDAHRIIALWREPGQALDLDNYNSAIMQLKLRDGPLTRVNCQFHAPTTIFSEN